MTEERDFKGVWIPKQVWLCPELGALDKIILVEIDSLDGERGCFSSNKHIAGFCKCSESKVAHTISRLCELGLVEVESFDGRTRVLRSRIPESCPICDPPVQGCLANFARQPCKNCKSAMQILQGLYIPSNIDEDTSKDILSKSGASLAATREKSSEEDAVVEAVIAHLNEVTGQRLRPSSRGHRRHILARYREGYSVEDLIAVIDKKAKEWMGSDMQAYVRPKTLFSAENFDTYLNQPDAAPRRRRGVTHAEAQDKDYSEYDSYLPPLQ